MFIHGGFFHLLGNMLFLWTFGPQTETCFNIDFDHRHRPRNSFWQFLLVYLLCGVGAVLLFSVFNVNSQTVLIGASGAISGVLGASAKLLWKEYRKMDILIFYRIPARIEANHYMVYWIAVQIAFHILFSKASTVAYLAHIGGFLTGVLLAFFRDALNKHNPFGMGRPI
jgi:membrane associated rhomboid family serine protease